MSTNIYQYNGQLLVSVPDGVLNTPAAPIAIPGKGYTNYGQPVMQDILWTMQNFAGTSPPTPLLQGTTWYDTGTNKLKLYTGSAWVGLFKENQTNSPSVDNTYDLGTPSLRFGTVYAATIAGTSITGDPTIMRTNQTNVPTADLTYSLGAAGARYVNVYASTFDGQATSAQYADVAERYEADAPMEVGDVVIIGGSKEITKSIVDSDIDVFGVISDKPALRMNDEAGSDETHPLVALLGRTPCKVIGPIGKGQRLVASAISGVARAAGGDEPVQAIIGRALKGKTSKDVGLVEVVVGRG